MAPEEYPVLLTEAALNPKANRELTTLTMFEAFTVPSMFLAPAAVLALRSTGRSTGVVLDCGGDVSQMVPIKDGAVLAAGVRWKEFGGARLAELMADSLTKRGHPLTTPRERLVARDILEKTGYVALDYTAELRAATDSPASVAIKYDLPDGTTIEVGAERLTVPEALMTPSLMGKKCVGVIEEVSLAIRGSGLPKEAHAELYANVVLAGGATLFRCFPERVAHDLRVDGADALAHVHVTAAPERKYAAWLGGSMLARLSTYRDSWITKAEYDEFGPAIVHRKCA